jgi:hypothetical protein
MARNQGKVLRSEAQTNNWLYSRQDWLLQFLAVVRTLPDPVTWAAFHDTHGSDVFSMIGAF